MTTPDAKRLIDRRHREYAGNVLRYEWLQDSYDGDHCYRDNTYGADDRGYPLHNLVRHKREYPIDDRGLTLPYTGSGYGRDATARAGSDDFELRRARTPIPNFPSEAIDTHLAKIYAAEIKRDGPEILKTFWDDVDGNGMSIDEWMKGEFAPDFRTFGLYDVCCDHPAIPEGEEVRSQADERRLKLDTCVMTTVLPQNMQWWRLDSKGNYLECVVREPQDDGKPYYRHWTIKDSTLYDDDGNILKVIPHGFGIVPIVRTFDVKDKRGKNTAKSWTEPLAILQREYYNRDSELILSDTIQAHPTIQGPEDMFTADASIPIGPSYALVKKKNNAGGTATYEGWEFVEPPKGGAESIRLNKQDIRDQADRYACLTKPAGAQGTTGTTVAQSGISKRLDASTANDLLTKFAATLARAEWKIANLALTVLSNGKPKPAAVAKIKVTYPGSFDLFSADEIAKAMKDFQAILADAGQCPEAETVAAQRLYGEVIQGLEDDQYERIDDEIEACIASKAEVRQQQSEAGIDPKTGQPIIPPPEPTSPQSSTTSPAKPAAKAKPKPKGKPKPPRAA